MANSQDDHFQPDRSDRVYPSVQVSGHARAVVGDCHYHIRIQDEYLDTEDELNLVDLNEIKTVSSLAWKLYKSCKADPDAFNSTSSDLVSLRAMLEECDEILPQITSPPQRARRLQTIITGCYHTLRRLETIVAKYDGLEVRQKWTWNRMGMLASELQEIRAQTTLHMSILTAFISTSQFNVEKKLERIQTELQRSDYEGSIMSFLTAESLNDDVKSQWRLIRKELENHGITLDMFDANKDFIYNWMEHAIINRPSEAIGFAEGHCQESSHQEGTVHINTLSSSRNRSCEYLGGPPHPVKLPKLDLSIIPDTSYKKFVSPTCPHTSGKFSLSDYYPSRQSNRRRHWALCDDNTVITLRSKDTIDLDLKRVLKEFFIQPLETPHGLLCRGRLSQSGGYTPFTISVTESHVPESHIVRFSNDLCNDVLTHPSTATCLIISSISEVLRGLEPN